MSSFLHILSLKDSKKSSRKNVREKLLRRQYIRRDLKKLQIQKQNNKTRRKNMKKVMDKMEKDEFIKKITAECWTYIKTVVDIVREPILILDDKLRVIAANENFYRNFQVEARDTEKKNVYELGNGQWNIPVLKKLLEEILPKNTFFKGFEVNHDFPFIGHKIMILNARQIHFSENFKTELFPSMIFLAIEDVTVMMTVADTIARHAKQLAAENIRINTKLEVNIERLEKEIKVLKKKIV